MSSICESDTLSDTTGSSSGIPSSDVTVLGHESVHSLVRDVEALLQRNGYVVSRPLVAGRPIEENLISRVKNAKITIIILKKHAAKQFQSFLEVLPPKPQAGSLNPSRTLILYEDGVKFRRVYENIIRLKLLDKAKKVADQISRFIEACAFAEIIAISDSTSFRDFNADLLLHSIINPRKTKTPLKLRLSTLEELFRYRYGNFCYMLVKDTTSVPEHVNKSTGFLLEDGAVLQTPSGATTAYNWFARVEDRMNAFETKQVKASSSGYKVQIEVSDLKEAHQLETTQSLANEWVCKSLASTSQPQKFEDTDINWKVTEVLRQHILEFDSRHSFFLISGKSTPPDTYRGIANIPWLKVFDFDTDGRESGLLSSTEHFLKNYTISTFQDSFRPLFNDKVDWLFPLGFSSKPDTIVKKAPLKWFLSFKASIEEQFSAISNFCTGRTKPVFVILWYDNEETNVKYLHWFLSVLFAFVKSDNLPKTVILCCKEDLPENSSLSNLIVDYELETTTIQTSPFEVLKYFASAYVPERPLQHSIKLPKAKGDSSSLEIVEIPKDNVWITDYLEVLPLESQAEIEHRGKENLGKEFVKGSTITWDELATGTIASQRGIKRKVSHCLSNDVIRHQKSIVVKILHAPGGGGTTFARQILWDLHTKVPCAVVASNLTLSITQITESIKFLHDHTLLPVVLLVDGRSDYEVEQLYENSKYAVVILHVQRSNHKISEAEYDTNLRKCCLPGSVTPNEAVNLRKVFSSFAPLSAKALTNLSEDVTERKLDRFIFEYGLTAFNHEFKGVRKYVHGYLKIENHSERIKNLKKWQKVVAYLSLVLYYGQNGLHRETFHNLLKENKQNEFVTLKDLPYAGLQFIVEQKEEWKIRYNVVAKEILEQILSPATNLDVSGNQELTESALSNLHELVIDFISMIKRVVKGSCPESVINVLMTMIIRRNYIDVAVQDGYYKRCRLSTLLEQVPIAENRVKILQHLTYTFPRHTEFHAHLGRLLNILGRYDEAEKSLQNALDIRMKQRTGINPNWSDDVLCRIHHMFGFGYLLQAKRKMNFALQNASPEKLLSFVTKAIHHFSLVRHSTTQNLSYGYIGEVRSRLLVVDYVHKTFKNGCLRAFDNDLGEENIALCEFVRHSHSVCDQLLAECRQYNPDSELRRLQDYSVCVEKFNDCFSEIKGNIPIWEKDDTNILFRRSQIASLKMPRGGNGNKLPSIDNISSKTTISTIISLHDKTFQETFSGNLRYISISRDVIEWLDAIRHPLADDNYSLVKVLQTVSEWERRNERGLATFYLYVIHFVLALVVPGQDICQNHNDRATELKEKMKAKKNLHGVVWRLEWLAKYDGQSIKKLVNKNKLGNWDKEKRFWKEKKSSQKLQVCTGTIVSSSHPLRGRISVDVPFPSRKKRIEVYFVPKLYNLYGSRFADSSVRVEFCIGFSPIHGAEAFQIKSLERNRCENCKIRTETLTINGGEYGTCANCQKPLKSLLKPFVRFEDYLLNAEHQSFPSSPVTDSSELKNAKRKKRLESKSL